LRKSTIALTVLIAVMVMSPVLVLGQRSAVSHISPTGKSKDPQSTNLQALGSSAPKVASPDSLLAPRSMISPMTVTSNSQSKLGTPLCNNGGSPCSGPIWDGGYQDQDLSSAPTASAVSILVAFPQTGAPSSFVQSGNYMAFGMAVESQSGCSGSNIDYVNFDMVYLTNSGQPSILGEIWQMADSPIGSASMVFSDSWTSASFTTTNYQSLLKLVMQWNSGTGNLDFVAVIAGVQSTLFSYTPSSCQQQVFHVGTITQSGIASCNCVDKWFQFGVMTLQTLNNGWNAYVGMPEYLPSGNWIQVTTATWLGEQTPMMDQVWMVGGIGGLHQGDGCRNGGSFPTGGSLIYGQMIVHPGPATSHHSVWDVYCQHDLYPPSSGFSSSSPASGAWQNGQFTVSFTDSKPGAVNSGLGLCFWSVDSLNTANNWISTLPPTVRGCNSSQTVTVGSGAYCPDQGSNKCRINAWAEDWVGNAGGNTLMIPSNDDSYTEGSASSWQMIGAGSTATLSDDTGTVIVGGKSVKGSWTAPGGDIVQMLYPSSQNLNIDVTSLGSNAMFRFFVISSDQTSNLCAVYLENDFNNGFISPGFRIGGTTWNYFEWTIGSFSKFGNGDWTRINSIMVRFDYAPGLPSSGNNWVDGLGLISASHGATIAGVFYPDYASSQTQRTFSIETNPPSAPSLVSPSNGAVFVGTTPAFSWAASSATSGIASYTLLLDTSPSFNSANLQKYSGITGTSYSLASSLPGATWYWEVQAFSNGGNTALSAAWQFTIQPDFTISSNPTSLTANRGWTATSNIYINAVSGFSGTVNLSWTRSPSTGTLICNLSQNSVTGSGQLVLGCFGDPGVYTVTVTGISGTLSHSTTVTYTIQYFNITANPISLTVNGGGTSTITISPLNGFSANVVLTTTIANSPPNFSCNMSPSTITGSGSSTLSCNGAAGNYVVTVTGTSGGQNPSVCCTISNQVSVSFSIGDFSISPGSLTYSCPVITGNACGLGAVTLTGANGFAGNVILTSNPSPGLSVTMSPSSLALSSTATSATSNPSVSATSGGTYTFTVTGTSGPLSHTTASITVLFYDFSLSLSCGSPGCGYALTPGYPVQDTLTVTSLGSFSGTVNLSVSTGGQTVSLSASSVPLSSGGQATVTVTITGGSASGTVTITGTCVSGVGLCISPPQTHSASVSVTISSGGGGGGGSIAHGSLITMADGSRVPVQNLKVGDKLLGYDPTTGTYTVSIVNSITVVDTTNMLIIHTSDGTPFRVDANPRQTLWVKTAAGTIGWMPVTQIKVGDDLWTQSGWVPVTGIEFAPAGHHVMYDIFASTPYFADGYLDPIHKM
jgi:hypothetical protein